MQIIKFRTTVFRTTTIYLEQQFLLVALFQAVTSQLESQQAVSFISQANYAISYKSRACLHLGEVCTGALDNKGFITLW